MITIAELFPTHNDSIRWLLVFRNITVQEHIRLEKEYSMRMLIEDQITWFLDNKIHRTDGPAVTRYFPNGNLKEEQWVIDGDLHREDLPAVIIYFENGIVKIKEWWKHNNLDHDRESSMIWYHEDGSVRVEWK